MKKTAVFLPVFALAIMATIGISDAIGAVKPFYIYTEKQSKQNHYAPSGWMGDVDTLRVSEGWPNAFRGASAIKISYTPKEDSPRGWAGIYWIEPAENWGNLSKGFDLSPYSKLVFWIKGQKGGEVINDILVGGIEGKYPDTTKIAVGPIDLSTEWQKFVINLEGQDLTNIIGGFGIAFNRESNPNGATFYLDEIRFE